MLENNTKIVNDETDEALSQQKTYLDFQILSYMVLIVISVGLFYLANQLPSSKWEPLGAGAFPKIILGAIASLSLMAFVSDMRKRNRLAEIKSKLNWNTNERLVIYLFILLFVYLGVTPYIGFSLASFIFLMVSQLMLGPKTLKSVAIMLIISVAFSYGISAFFSQIFNIYLPRPTVFG